MPNFLSSLDKVTNIFRINSCSKRIINRHRFFMLVLYFIFQSNTVAWNVNIVLWIKLFIYSQIKELLSFWFCLSCKWIFVHHISRNCITKMKKNITIFVFICAWYFSFCCARLGYFPMQWKISYVKYNNIFSYDRTTNKICIALMFTIKQISISKHILFYLEGFTSCRASSCFEFTNKLFIQVSSFFCFLQVSLNFSELGQIQSSNFFCLFYLLLVGLDL